MELPASEGVTPEWDSDRNVVSSYSVRIFNIISYNGKQDNCYIIISLMNTKIVIPLVQLYNDI